MNNTIVLHTYWLNVVSIKKVLFDETDLKFARSEPKTRKEYSKRHYFHSRLMIIYALMYVVIEGYKDSKLSHGRIDELLENTYFVDKMRRFRNSIFHIQKSINSEKMMEFLAIEGTDIWTKELYYAFDDFFENLYPEENYLTYLIDSAKKNKT